MCAGAAPPAATIRTALSQRPCKVYAKVYPIPERLREFYTTHPFPFLAPRGRYDFKAQSSCAGPTTHVGVVVRGRDRRR